MSLGPVASSVNSLLYPLGLALALLSGVTLAYAQDPGVADEVPTEPVITEPVIEVAPEPDTANLMGLNKITARTHPMRVKLDTPLRFGTLGIILRACEKARPEDPPKTIAFLEIREYPVNEEITAEPEPIFSGWMLASSPGLNALEHPVYDVWLTDCTISSAAASAPSE